MTTDDLSPDVLEAGASLGDPVADAGEPKERKLRIMLVIDGVLAVAAIVGAFFAPTLKTYYAIGWAVGVLLLLAIAGLVLLRLRKLRESEVALFENGFVHATGDGLKAVSWESVKLAYIVAGKRIMLTFDDARPYTLKAPSRNFAQIEKAVRAGVGRDKVRRGAPPKNLASV
jgi:MFS family permease